MNPDYLPLSTGPYLVIGSICVIPVPLLPCVPFQTHFPSSVPCT